MKKGHRITAVAFLLTQKFDYKIRVIRLNPCQSVV